MSSLSNRRSSPGLTPIPWTSTTKNRRLTEVKETNAQNQVVLDEVFTYDVNNNLIGEAVNGVPQRYTVYDGDTPYMDLNAAGQVSERYLADPNALAMYWARVGVTGQADWMVTDLLGSVRELVSASGSVEDQIAYDAYGNVVSETNPSAGGRLKYAGGQYDGGLAAYLFGRRWYNPVDGNWWSQDPLGLGPDMNPYRYVGNDPTGGTDPYGEFPILGLVIIGGIIGGALFFGSAPAAQAPTHPGESIHPGFDFEGAAFVGMPVGAGLALGAYGIDYGAAALLSRMFWRAVPEAAVEAAPVGEAAAAAEAAPAAEAAGAEVGAEAGATEAAAEAPAALTEAQQRAIVWISNTIRDHLTDSDIRGAVADMVGNPVPRPGGGFYNHIQEVNEAINVLRNQLKILQGVNHPEAEATRQAALEAIRRAEEAR
jgi:RHS repeat-associated protein